MYLRLLLFAVTTLKTLQCSPYGHRSFPIGNDPFFPGDSPGFNPSRATLHPGVGLHRNEFWNPDHFYHIGPTIHGPQVDIDSQPLGPPFQFDDGPFGNRPTGQNSFLRPQEPRRPFNGRPNGFIPSRDDDSDGGRPQPDGTFNERPTFTDRPSRQNPQQRPQPGRPFNERPNVNGGSSRQNPPVRPQPGRPFNGRPSINIDPSRQNPPVRPSLFLPPEENDSEEVFVFDRPTSKRPPTTRRTTTTTTTAITTTTPRNCDCPSTPEFNPVCGTNGQTYSNPGKLKCAVVCGTDVRLNYYGACIATTESTSSTASTTDATSSRNNLF